MGDKGGGAGLWNQVQIFTTFHPGEIKENSHLSAWFQWNVQISTSLKIPTQLTLLLPGGDLSPPKKEADLASNSVNWLRSTTDEGASLQSL